MPDLKTLKSIQSLFFNDKIKFEKVQLFSSFVYRVCIVRKMNRFISDCML